MPQGHKPLQSHTHTAGTSTNITPSSSQFPSPMSSLYPSPIVSYHGSPSSSSFPSPRYDHNAPQNPFSFLYNSIPSSLSPLRISNSAPVTPPLSSPTSKSIKPMFNFESFAKESMNSLNYQIFAASAPASPTRRRRFTPDPIPECEESDSSTVDSSCQWATFRKFAPNSIPASPTYNLVKPVSMINLNENGNEEMQGPDFQFGNGQVMAWEGERIHNDGMDDLELTLGTGKA